MDLQTAIVRQFERPHGRVGAVAGWIMGHRPGNVRRNVWTVEQLSIPAGARVLEVGCGPGVGLATVLAQHLDAHVVGLDHSPTMLRQAARRNAAALRDGRLELVESGVEGLDRAGPYHRIFSSNVMQFVRPREAVLARLFDALSPGGILASTFEPRGRGASRADAERFAHRVAGQMEEVGFVELRREWLELGSVPAVCVLGRRPVADVRET